MQYQLLIFDWDGTLMDSEARIITCIKAASRDLKQPEPDETAIRNIIGLGLQEALAALFPTRETSLLTQLAERYRYHFMTADPTPSPLFPGVETMLSDLKQRGYWLAIATGKGRTGLQKALRETGLEQMFLATRCAGDTASKPHPQMLFELLEELGTGPEQALMVGDTEYDLQMAKNANMPALAVSYGVHERRRLLQYDPVECVDSVTELHNWLQIRLEHD